MHILVTIFSELTENLKLYLLGDLDLNSNAVEKYEMFSMGIMIFTMSKYKN